MKYYIDSQKAVANHKTGSTAAMDSKLYVLKTKVYYRSLHFNTNDFIEILYRLDYFKIGMLQ